MQPETLTLEAPAKINLFLHVVGQREDGYHLLESAFELIDWSDRIVLSARPDGEIERCGDMLGPPALDLAVRAASDVYKRQSWD